MERYEPELLADPQNAAQLAEFVQREFRRISIALAGALPSELQELHVAPVKLRNFMIVAADGTDWDPGAGQGVYAYYNGTWNKLG